MRGMLERLRRRTDSATRESDGPSASVTAGVATARALTDALDRAVELGLAQHAERVAAAAARIARHHPRLTDRLARLRLAQGDPDTAVALIDACDQMPASLRLLRAACLLRLGRTVEAHLDLHRWSRRPSAPLAARLLLALLEWAGGDRRSATEALRRNLQQMEDPRTLELLVLINADDGRDDWLREWSVRLRSAAAWTTVEPDPDLLLLSLGLPQARETIQPTSAQVEILATELIATEQVIPALVEAQRRRTRDQTVGLLARAIETALPDLTHPDVAMEHLARLALLGDDPAAARGWVDRALKANPMSASLAFLAHELSSADAPETAVVSRAVVARIGGSLDAPTAPGKGKAA